MRKIIKLKLENTNRIRTTEDTYCEIYSHDKNNGLFEFEIVNEYLTVENPKAVFKFVGSNKVWQTDGTVVDGRIKVKFDTTLITHDENVVCWLYLDEEQRSSDAYRFKFKVKLSEIDKVDGYETKERFIKDTVIVDRLDVMTREDLDRAIKDIQAGAFSKDGLLTEAKAEETYAKKSEAVDNTNFELVKNRVLALELKTDKDTVYDDSEVKQRLTTLENKPTIDTSHFVTDETLETKGYIKDVSNLATKEELEAVRGSQPSVDNLVTKDELAGKNYLTEHQNLDEYAKKSEIPQEYNDTEVKERLTNLENKAPVDLSNLATKEELNEVRNSQPTVDTSNLITRDELAAKNYLTDEVLENKGYLKSHQSLENLVTKQELEEKHFLTDQALNNYALKSELYNDTDLKSRVEVLEQKTDKDTVYDDTPLKERVTALESKAIEGGAYDDKPIRDRLDVLEAKHDNDTIYDDTEVKRRLTELESKPAVDTSVFVTDEKLNSKGYLTEHQSLENVVTKDELNSKGYLTTHQDISNLATKEELAKVVTKEELEAKHFVTDEVLNSKQYLTEDVLNSKNYLTTHQSLENLVTKDELENKGYLTTHQSLENYALKSELPQPYNDSEVKQRLGVLEAKQDKDTIYDDTPLKERVTALESKAIEGGAYDDSDLRNRVVALESKEDKDTKYDDTDLRNRVTTLENKPPLDTSEFVTNQVLESKGYIKDVSNLVTKDELENKHFLTEHQDLSSLVTKQELENKGYLTQHQPLDNLVTKEELNSKGYITEEVLNGKNYLTEDVLNTKNYLTQHQDLSSLVSKQELENKHYLTEHQNISHLVSKDELETKGYLTQHQSLEEYAKKSELYNDTDIKQRLTTLENKPNIDTSNFVTNEQLEGKHYLTEHQPLTHLATNSDLEALRNVSVSKSELSKKFDTTEFNTFKENVVTKDELAGKGYLTTHQDISNLATKQEVEDTYAKKSELPTPYNDSALVQKIGQLEARVDNDTVYNDEPIKQRLTALESRPTFDTLTAEQRNSLKGERGERGSNGENGHSLSANVRIEGSYKNGATSQLNLFSDVFYDGEVVTSGYTLDYYYRGFGNNNWQVLNNQTPDSNGKFGTWSQANRSGGFFEVKIVVNYRGLKASSFARLDNVNDGERGATGANGRDGQPGQNIVNQKNNQALKYWCGTETEYNAISTKDANTIYDIFK